MIRATILALSIATATWAQTGEIYGTITGEEGPLPGANALVVGLDIGAVSNGEGDYRIRRVPTGVHEVRFSMVGHTTIVREVEVASNEETRIDVRLETQAIETDAVEVIGENLRKASDTETSVVNLEPERAKALPGAGEDVMRTLQALPGVLAPSEASSQLVVRGGGPDQNLIIIDNIEVFNPYRLYGAVSMFNPDAVKNINLVTGGFPARYGDRLSAVLDVTGREGVKNKPITGSLNASIISANLVLEGQNPFGVKGSWLFNSRRTYYDIIMAPIAKSLDLVEDEVEFPNFYDFQLKLTLGPWEGHKLNLFGIYSADGVDIVSGEDRPSPDSVALNNITRNDVAGITYQYAPTVNFLNEFSASWYQNSGDIEADSKTLDPSLNRENFQDAVPDTLSEFLLGVELSSSFAFRKTSLADHVTFFWGENHVFDAGVGFDHMQTLLEFEATLDPQLEALLRSLPQARIRVDDLADEKFYYRYHAYAQNKFAFADRLYIHPGLRYDYYQILEKPYLAPRVAVSFAIDDLTTLRAAWGHYYQSPGYEKIRDQGLVFDLSEANTAPLEAERATHYIVGLERWLTEEWDVRVEGYYKDYEDLIVPKIVEGTRYYTERIPGRDRQDPAGWTRPVPVPGDSITQIPVNDSYGETYGVELLLAKRNVAPDSRLNGWISYAFAFAERVNNGRTTPFRFDRRHSLDVVLDYELSESWSVGARWQLASGFPATEPIGTAPRVILADTDGDLQPETPTISTRNGEVVYNVDYGANPDLYNARRPLYNRLDARGSYYTTIWGKRWTFYLDVINILNIDNVNGYRFYVEEDGSLGSRERNMFPILPTFGINVQF
ncbi:MAG: TonB-dependent receptor plug domain-containing protein [Ignavibacteriales bacterium]|nr:TonB-dependent receptor plug domain-containing protein [Ignavibacteriales bacterium]